MIFSCTKGREGDERTSEWRFRKALSTLPPLPRNGGENDDRSEARQDRSVRRAKTASHNGKICVNGGVIKHPSYARMCVAVADVETGL